jgi:hypothetical protein
MNIWSSHEHTPNLAVFFLYINQPRYLCPKHELQ